MRLRASYSSSFVSFALHDDEGSFLDQLVPLWSRNRTVPNRPLVQVIADEFARLASRGGSN